MKVGLYRKVRFPDLLRQTPGGKGVWDGIEFSENLNQPLDALLVFNHVHADVVVCCPRDRVWCVMQEPYHRGMSDWMVEDLGQFSRVLSPIRPDYLPDTTTHHLGQGCLPWFIDKGYDILIEGGVPHKTNDLSFISSNRCYLPGHRRRLDFMSWLHNEGSVACDFYGRGIRKIEDKWDALAPYRYSIVVENTVAPHYWTEKLADSFLALTLPFYFGCPNVDEYFPEGAVIMIDITKPAAAMHKIHAAIAKGEWEKRLPLLIEARARILTEYQLFAYVAKMLKQNYPHPKKAERFQLQAYRGSSEI
jgi:hypothetical protein